MGASARQLDDALARLERLERKLDQLLSRERPRRADAPELLTKRAAARILGCDRATTLEALIRSGRLRGVPAPSGKGLRIPRGEVERLLRAVAVGAASTTAAASSSRSKAPRDRLSARADAAQVATGIRAIPIPRGVE